MIRSNNRTTAGLTFFVFLVFSFAPIFSWERVEQNSAEKLIRDARQYFSNGLYEKAIMEFEKALEATVENDIKASIYLDLSLSYFHLQDEKKTEDMLRKLFELDSDIDIDESRFDSPYSIIYKKVKAEYWFSIRSDSDNREKEDRKIIAKRSSKPGKKKNKLLSILLIGGVVIAAVVMAFLFWQDGGEERRGYLSITNNADHFISVTIGPLNTRVEANNRTTLTLAEGVHVVRISYSGESVEYTVEIIHDQTTSLVFQSF